jgi:hypothetical protein
MKQKRMPSEAEFTMLEAMFSTDPQGWNQWLVSQGHEPFLDLPECIALIPKDEWVDGTKVVTPPAVQKYLDTGDTLTPHTIEMMELAIEKAYGVEAPWYITSAVPYYNPEKGETPVVEYFRLGSES